MNKYFVASILSFLFILELRSQSIYIPRITESQINAPINTSNQIGTVTAQAAVNENGAFNYNIPIKIPPGTNGMEPSLAVVYNSQSGNGLLGRGWQLVASSVITRANKTLYYNQKVGAVNLDNNDQLVLDGQPLISFPNSEYYREQEDFSQITRHGDLSSTSCWFELETKDGRILEFGNSANSKILSEDNSTILTWHLNKVTNPNGNYIVYEYGSSNDQHYLDKIKYTGNSNGLAPYNEVKFEYLEREDANTSYIYGNPIENRYLLEEISIYSDGSFIKKYKFKYSTNSTSSFLAEVNEIGSNGQKLNPTIFKYGDIPASSDQFTEKSCNNFDTWNKYVPGDYNGDGLTDILAIDKVWNDDINGYYDEGFKLYIKNSNRENYSFSLELSGLFDQYFRTWEDITIPNYYNYLNSDYTGDGADDILILDEIYLASSGISYCSKAKIYSFHPDNLSFSYQDFPIAFLFNEIPENRRYFFPGDFNGDGLQDFITLLNEDTSGFILRLNSPSISTSTIISIDGYGAGNYPGDEWVEADDIHILDFNGDGKMELMKIDEFTTQIYEFREGSFSSITAYKIYEGGYPTKYHDVQLADFNGDGKTDIFTCSRDANNPNLPWHIGYSTGKGFEEVNTGITTLIKHENEFTDLAPSLQRDEFDHLLISDFNGDGLTDILYAEPVIGAGSDFHLFYSNGTNDIQQLFYYKKYSNSNIMGATVFPGDFNGDGKSELFHRLYAGSNQIEFYRFFANSPDLQLEKIRDGLGNILTVEQKPLTDGDYVYQKSDPVFYYNNPGPLICLNVPIYVTSSLSETNGVGGENITTYKYLDAMFHKHGKGLLGFKKFEQRDLANETTVFNDYQIDDNYFAKYLSKTTTFIQDIPESVTDYDYSFVDQGSDRFWLRLDNVYTENLKLNSYQSTDYTYDSYGNVRRYTQDINGVKEIIRDSYFTQVNTWIPAHPYLVFETSKRHQFNAGNDYSKTTEFIYDPGSGNIDIKRDYAGTQQSITTDYDYDDYGNVVSKIVSSAGLPSINLTRSYDNKGRFPVSETNTLNQTKQVKFNKKWGQIQEETDINGLTTSYAYDGFGRLYQITLHNGYSITSTLNWDINQDYIYNIKTNGPNRPTSIIYYDKKGREVKSKTFVLKGKASYTTTKYDHRGNVIKQSDPYLSSPTIFTETFYNADKTVKKVSRFSSASAISDITNSYDYSNGLTTVTSTSSSGRTREKTIDATGITIKAEDDGGLLEFFYDGKDNLVQAKLNGSTVIESDFNSVGQQTSLNDVNAGKTTYNYDLYGQLVSQTDARGLTSSFTYDQLGRITVAQFPEGSIEYEYVQTGYGINNIKEITGFNNIGKKYEYDHLGRVISLEENIGGATYISLYEYDDFDNLTRITYPSGLIINYDYDSDGNLTTLKDEDQNLLYFNDQQDAYGRNINYVYGNGLQNSIQYDSENFPVQILSQGLGNMFALNMHYTFDKSTGNLEQRHDNLNLITEEFSYDDLDRLRKSKITGQNAIQVNYADNGNIVSKTDVGHYSYDLDKINAVSRISNYQNTVTSLKQDIEYTSFQQPKRIEEGPVHCEGNWAYPELDPELVDIVSDFTPDQVRNMEFGFGVSEDEYTLLELDEAEREQLVGYVTAVSKLEILGNSFNEDDVHGESVGSGKSSGDNLKEENDYARWKAVESGYCRRTHDYIFHYGIEQQRKEMIYYYKAKLQFRRHYADDLEINYYKDQDPQYVHYISGGGGLNIIAVKQGEEVNFYYAHTDYLGSILAVTDQNANVVARQNFDAWGQARDNDWVYSTTDDNPSWLYRGFTGHEHYYPVSLINMNGRMYDPVINRILNPDNYVQSPFATQNYNRYTYALNNPLKYTDPSGEYFVVDDLIAAVVGGLVNLGVNAFNGNLSGMGFWETLGKGAAAFGAGAASGTLALYGPAGWAAGGAITGGTNAWLSGATSFGDIATGAAVGTFSGVVGGAAGQWAANGLGGVVINGFNITSPVAKGIVGGAIGGAAGGYAGGFAAGYLMTGNASSAHQAGLSGLYSGVAIGGVAGGVGGYAAAKKAGINPWTGKPNNSTVIGGPQDRVNDYGKMLDSETISNDWPDDLPAYLGKDAPNPKALEFNQMWIEQTIRSEYYIYDVGRTGHSPFYHGVEVPTIQNYNYGRVYKVTHIQTIRTLIIYR